VRLQKWNCTQLLRVTSILLFLNACARSQQLTGKTDEVTERIVGAAMARGGAMAFLETLTDTVGGRVTGSAESQAASELILKALKDAGFDNAHFEEYALAVRWQRGPATGRVVSPVKQPILIQSYGWAPGTNGRTEVPLVAATFAANGKLSGDLSKVRGAAVLMNLASGAGLSASPNYVVRRSSIARELANGGAAAIMIESDKPDRMLYTSAAGIYPGAPLPMLSVAKEDALFLRRLLAKGDVKIEFDVENSFGKGPGKERNVIADLPGTSSQEIVLLGAHFDSWDTAPSANDDGSGIAAVLETARILKSLGVKTKATIRFAFFSGEEQACLGSRAYVLAHNDTLEHHWAALTMDNGAQMPLGFSLNGRTDLQQPTKHLLTSLTPMGAGAVDAGGDLSDDDETFVVAGIPSLDLLVMEGDSDTRHHAITDTLDKIDPRALALDTAVLAVASYSIANADQRLGRRLTVREVQELLKNTGEAEYVELDYGRQEQKEP
jgi:carboxypeptidase Q